jgi:Ca2+:H+ antiporter
VQRRQETDRWASPDRDVKINMTSRAGLLTDVPAFDLGLGLSVRPAVTASAGQPAPGARMRNEQDLSLEISIVLFITYILSLVFTLKTHRHLYGAGGHGAEHAGNENAPSVRKAVGLLVIATIGVAVMAELLVGAAETTAERLGWNEVFVGVILLAIIGNAAEHSTAVLMALKNKMDAAVNIAVGSSIQVALFVAPMLVFLSYVIGPTPMNLLFTTLEVLAISLSVGIIALIAHDGESHWMEGVQLLAVYTILGIAFFWLPH